MFDVFNYKASHVITKILRTKQVCSYLKSLAVCWEINIFHIQAKYYIERVQCESDDNCKCYN